MAKETIRTYEAGDREQILRLAGKVFGHLSGGNDTFPYTAEWFDWRVLGAPRGPADVSVAVTAQGEVVAHQLMEPHGLDTPEGRVPIGLASLTMADPDHKGFGGLKTMLAVTRRAQQSGTVAYGLPNDLSLPMFERLGWTHIGNIPVVVRPVLTPMRFTAMGLGRGGLSIERITRFDHEIEALTTHPDLPFRFKLGRDAAALNWRYVDNPLKRYEIRVARRGADLVGLVVFRAGRLGGVPCGLLMDLIAVDPPALHRLLTVALRWFLRHGQLAVSAFMLESSWYAQALRSRGFVAVPPRYMPKQNALIVLDNGGHPGISDPANWYLSYGDWDCL